MPPLPPLSPSASACSLSDTRRSPSQALQDRTVTTGGRLDLPNDETQQGVMHPGEAMTSAATEVSRSIALSPPASASLTANSCTVRTCWDIVYTSSTTRGLRVASP